MGGKMSSAKCEHMRKYGGGYRGAVVLENNYALKEENTDRPTYIMGYVNTFAVEKYQSDDTEEGLPYENYEEDEVFVSNLKFPPSNSLDSCTSHSDNSTYFLIDSHGSTPPYNSTRCSKGKGLVLMNNAMNSNHVKAFKSHLYNNNVHISTDSEHYALIQDRDNQNTTLHEDISTLNIRNEEYQLRNSRST